MTTLNFTEKIIDGISQYEAEITAEDNISLEIFLQEHLKTDITLYQSNTGEKWVPFVIYENINFLATVVQGVKAGMMLKIVSTTSPIKGNYV